MASNEDARAALIARLAKDIDFAIDVTEPQDVRLRRFQTLIEIALGVWTIDEQSEDAALVNIVTAVTREADRDFERVGGSSRHWVRDCFLPTLNKSGHLIVHAAALRASAPSGPSGARAADAACATEARLRAAEARVQQLTDIVKGVADLSILISDFDRERELINRARAAIAYPSALSPADTETRK